MKKMEIIQPPYYGTPGFDDDMVWYSPELDELRVAKRSDGYVFINEYGQFHAMYYNGSAGTQIFDFYLIGSLEPKTKKKRSFENGEI